MVKFAAFCLTQSIGSSFMLSYCQHSVFGFDGENEHQIA